LLWLSSVAVIGVIAIACSREENSVAPDRPAGDDPPRVTEPPTPETTPDQESLAELERLTALGYIGWTTEEADPQQSGLALANDKLACPGYYLYNSRNLCEAVLVDHRGRRLNSWRLPHRYWSHVELSPNGDLVIIGAENIPNQPRMGITAGNYIARMSWDGELLSKTHVRAHHDFEVLPGNRIITLLEYHHSIPEYRENVTVFDNEVAVLSDRGEVIESVSLYKLFVSHPDVLPLQRVPVMDYGDGRFVDPFHVNSVEWLDPAPSLRGTHDIYTGSKVLICVRFQDLVCVIDWESKRPVWVWGRGELDCPHHASLLDNGHILVFDNGRGRRFSRVVEVDPRSGGIVWQYKAANPQDFFSVSRGAAQRLPNGNTLITESDRARAFQVTPLGEIVWEFHNPVLNRASRRATIVRMEYYDLPYVNAILRAVANRG